jgi:hypothetical protein
MEQLTLFTHPPVEVAQHNNLIFAPFALGSLENRIFISMLERIDRNGEHFDEWRIPITDILKHRGGNYYEELDKARKALVGLVVDVAPIKPEGKRSSRPRTIVYKCDHDEGKGYIICQFHEHMREYLLRLVGNYTRADLAILKSFKDEKSVRFYWMLKSRFFNKTEVVITVEECRQCLLPIGSKAYPNPTELKKHVLERVIKPEIDKTDCAFEFGNPVKAGVRTQAWTFVRQDGALSLLEPEPISLPAALIEELENLPLDRKGIQRINDYFHKEVKGITVDEAFIRFVIATRRKESQSKEISNLGGYIVDTITEGWLAKQYQKSKKKETYHAPPPAPKASEASSKTITRAELELAYNQLSEEDRSRYPTVAALIYSYKMQGYTFL